MLVEPLSARFLEECRRSYRELHQYSLDAFASTIPFDTIACIGYLLKGESNFEGQEKWQGCYK
jgi:hypothetical protein